MRDLLVSLKPATLLLADRNFLGWQLWREAAATGAEEANALRHWARAWLHGVRRREPRLFAHWHLIARIPGRAVGAG